MNPFQLNLAATTDILSRCKSKVAKKQCYANVFHVATSCMQKLTSGEWRIAYGFVFSTQNIYVRHAFFLDQDDKVIDPTPFSGKKDREREQYFVFKTFGTVSEYLDAINQEGGYPALSRFLRVEEQKLQQWGYENGYLFIG